MALKMIQKTYEKIDSNIIENMEQKWFQKWSRTMDAAADVDGCCAWGGPGRRLGTQKANPRDPKWTILAPKMTSQSSQNGDQDPPADTENATQATDA